MVEDTAPEWRMAQMQNVESTGNWKITWTRDLSETAFIDILVITQALLYLSKDYPHFAEYILHYLYTSPHVY